MKIQCLNKNLKDVVVIAERNTSKNQTLPILNSILLEANKDKIKIRATNLETAIEINVFLVNIGDDQIILQTQKNNLFIKTNTIETTIRGYPPEDFPIFPKLESPETFTLTSPELRQGLSSVVIASSVSDIKPELASIFFSIFKNTIKMLELGIY